MRKALKYIFFPIFCVFGLQAGAQVVPLDTIGFSRENWTRMEGEFVRQVQPRDSILIGDQIEYGFILENLEDGVILGSQPYKETFDVTKDWEFTIVGRKPQGAGTPDLIDVEGTIRLALFEEGQCKLPPIIVGRVFPSGEIDTVYFDPIVVDVKTIPLDVENFEVHPMTGPIDTPFNWAEFIYTLKELWAAFISILPWLLIARWVIILIIVGICVKLIYERKSHPSFAAPREPAHIVALRKLDTLRSNALWVPEKQKMFYTGVTDALREYISYRYGISAMEMTSAELFNEMKNLEGVTSDQLSQIKELFETADFVKFAKFVASDEDNASAVPRAVRFVTETYQIELEKQQDSASEEVKDKK
jgi:hypothetical protein